MREPELRPTSYLTLAVGTLVVDRFGQPLGEVERVLLHADETFDGIIVRTPVGRRFIDAPEVRRLSARAVTLGIAAGDVECPATDTKYRRGRVPGARWDRTQATEADRDAVVDSLKVAFVRDELSVDELAHRVEAAHVAERLDQLDAVLADLSLG
jgi:Domain of unknown function (DUF1707)